MGTYLCGPDEPGQPLLPAVPSHIGERIEAHMQRFVRQLAARRCSYRGWRVGERTVQPAAAQQADGGGEPD